MEIRNHQLLIAGDGEVCQAELAERFRRLGGYDVKNCPASELPHLDKDKLPDVLLLILHDARAEQELSVLEQLPISQQVPILAIGPGDDTQLMRKAMRLGVKDYLVAPPDGDECVNAVRSLILQREAGARGPSKSELIAFINAKGGSGASLLAGNVAHLMVSSLKLPTSLVDLDLQFGSLSTHLDLTPERHLLEVINVIDELDSVAVRSYLTKHRDGLEVLLTRADDVILPGEVAPQRLARLLRLLRTAFPYVVVDLPRLIDPLTTLVLGEASHVVVVVQQSLAHIRDARRLHHIMTMDLGISPSRLTVVVNRYDKKAGVSLEDIAKVLPNVATVTICNDYQHVAKAVDLGKPLSQYAPSAPITAEILRLAERVTGRTVPQRKGFWSRLFG